MPKQSEYSGPQDGEKRDIVVSRDSHRPLLTTAQVARWLGVSPRTLCLWAECREIPAIKVGRHWRFSEDDIRGLLGRSDFGGKPGLAPSVGTIPVSVRRSTGALAKAAPIAGCRAEQD
jgi:excisionase family DNA binding protein